MYQNFIPQYGLLQELLLLFRSRKIRVTVCLYAPTEVYHHRIIDVLNVGVPFHLVSILNDQGPGVKAIVRLTSSLRGQLIKRFSTLLPNTPIFFVEKMREAFALQKASHNFPIKILAYFRYIQSIVRLTSSLRGQLIKCFTTFFTKCTDIFVEKMREAFAMQKASHNFPIKILAYFRY